MQVKDLIERLSDFDPEAEVRVVEQPNYPLIADIDEWSSRTDGGFEERRGGKLVYIHLGDADDYYSREGEEG